MSRKSRQPRPPRQSVTLPGGAVDLSQSARDREAQAKAEEARKQAEQQAALSKIGDLGMFIYAMTVNTDVKGEARDVLWAVTAQDAMDAALLFARTIWGMNVQRAAPVTQQEGAVPPQPILD